MLLQQNQQFKTTTERTQRAEETPARDEISINQHTSLCCAAGRTHDQNVSSHYKIPSQIMRGGRESGEESGYWS